MNSEKNYVIQADIKFGVMEKFDIGAGKGLPHEWFNPTFCQVSDSLVHLD
jgi:hypothetical protein